MTCASSKSDSCRRPQRHAFRGACRELLGDELLRRSQWGLASPPRAGTVAINLDTTRDIHVGSSVVTRQLTGAKVLS